MASRDLWLLVTLLEPQGEHTLAIGPWPTPERRAVAARSWRRDLRVTRVELRVGRPRVASQWMAPALTRAELGQLERSRKVRSRKDYTPKTGGPR